MTTSLPGPNHVRCSACGRPALLTNGLGVCTRCTNPTPFDPAEPLGIASQHFDEPWPNADDELHQRHLAEAARGDR